MVRQIKIDLKELLLENGGSIDSTKVKAASVCDGYVIASKKENKHFIKCFEFLNYCRYGKFHKNLVGIIKEGYGINNLSKYQTLCNDINNYSDQDIKYSLTKLYLIDMKKKDSGIILNVASIAGFLPGPLMATYYAAKNYVVRLSEAIKEELARDKSKVQISLLCPGPVKTNFNNVANVKFELSSLSSEYVARYTVKQLLKGKFYIVPGFTVRCAKLFSKITPNFILRKICYNTQKRKEG